MRGEGGGEREREERRRRKRERKWGRKEEGRTKISTCRCVQLCRRYIGTYMYPFFLSRPPNTCSGRGRKGRRGEERREGGGERGGEGRGEEGGGRRRKWGSTYLGSGLVLDEFLERREGNLDNMWVLCLTCKQQRVDNIVCLS